MKSAYFNDAKAGKTAIVVVVNGNLAFDTDTVVGMVNGKPLYIRWNAKSANKSVEVYYTKVVMNFDSPYTIISVLSDSFPMGELASALTALTTLDKSHTAPTLTAIPSKKPKKTRKPHVTNPVKKAIVSGEASEFLDPELEQFLALLAECI